MVGWRDDLGPWKPVLEGDRLYGRGGADDGYSAFASLLAIEAAQREGLSHARCVVLIEASEESGSAGPAAVPRGARRPHRHAVARAVPRLRLPRLRAPVGDHVAARPRRRVRCGGVLTEGRALGRGERRRAVVVPDPAPAARPRRGLGDGCRAAPRAERRDPSGPRTPGDATAPSSRSRSTSRSSTARADHRRPGGAAPAAHVAPDGQHHRRRGIPGRRQRGATCCARTRPCA
jgi:hypothetical protein